MFLLLTRSECSFRDRIEHEHENRGSEESQGKNLHSSDLIDDDLLFRGDFATGD